MELPKETIERMIEEAKCYRPLPTASKERVFLTDMCEHYYQGLKSEALHSLSEIEKLKEENERLTKQLQSIDGVLDDYSCGRCGWTGANYDCELICDDFGNGEMRCPKCGSSQV